MWRVLNALCCVSYAVSQTCLTSHLFPLDCIGSAFNTKGVMQCPNCRKVEKGQWLYANGCRSNPEFSAEEWVHEEDIYDIGTYSELVIAWSHFSAFSCWRIVLFLTA